MINDDRKQGTVLIVDDDPHNLMVLKDLLTFSGFSILLAEDGAQGIVSAELGRPDLVLLDIAMPEMDGYETCKQLKANAGTCHIPVIFLSALGETENIVKGFSVGGVDYITKPFRREEVLARVITHLTLQRQKNELKECNKRLEAEIGERKQAALALKKSEARKQALLDAIPDMIFRLDRNGVYLDYKADKAELCAQDVETIIGKRCRDIAPEYFADQVDGYIEKTLESGEIQTFEYELPIPGLGMRNYETRMVKSGADEVTAIVRDMTEQKKMAQERLLMERRIQTQQRLESLGVMAGGIAHDFNNSMMIVLGYLELARRESPGSDGWKRYLGQCEKALQRPVNLARQMLTYTGKEQFHIRPVAVDTLIRQARTFLKTEIPDRVSLRLHISPGLPKIGGDPAQLHQILTNLILNAAESYPHGTGGEVVVTAAAEFCDKACLSGTIKDLWVSYDEPLVETTYVYIDISDSGCGMSEPIRNRLFEPFFTTKFLGRGLGMAAVFGIVRGHGGYIRIDSLPGSGTTVRVLFPALEQVEVPAEKKHPQTAVEISSEGGLVLLVEDEKEIRNLVQQMFGKLGYKVICASSGEEAIRIFGKRKADIVLVLSDLTMPGMSGLKLRDIFHQMESTVPVILSSGYNPEDLELQYGAEEIDGYLQKPYRLRDLAILIRAVRDTGNSRF